MALKFPGGDAFAYMDDNSVEDSTGKLMWTLGYDWAATSDVPLAATLQQLYKHPVSSLSSNLRRTHITIAV